MTNCFECLYFRQESSLRFSIPGHCSWDKYESIPKWLERHAEDDDRYYGAKRAILSQILPPGDRRSGGQFDNDGCNQFISVGEDVIQKRNSDTWYE